MKRWMIAGATFMVVCMMILVLSACKEALIATAGAGVGAVTTGYVRGDLTYTEAVDYETAWSALKLTLDELNYKIDHKNKDGGNASIIAYDGKKKESERLEVELARKGSDTTEFTVRVGVMGDQQESLYFRDEINKRIPRVKASNASTATTESTTSSDTTQEETAPNTTDRFGGTVRR